jgi:hypothetical protein
MKQFKLAQVIKEEVRKQLNEIGENIKIVDAFLDYPAGRMGDNQINVAFDNDPEDNPEDPSTWRVIPIDDFNIWFEQEYKDDLIDGNYYSDNSNEDGLGTSIDDWNQTYSDFRVFDAPYDVIKDFIKAVHGGDYTQLAVN